MHQNVDATKSLGMRVPPPRFGPVIRRLPVTSTKRDPPTRHSIDTGQEIVEVSFGFGRKELKGIFWRNAVLPFG
jgi:hypothetical protein